MRYLIKEMHFSYYPYISQVALVAKNPPASAGDIKDAAFMRKSTRRFPKGSIRHMVNFKYLWEIKGKKM